MRDCMQKLSSKYLIFIIVILSHDLIWVSQITKHEYCSSNLGRVSQLFIFSSFYTKKQQENQFNSNSSLRKIKRTHLTREKSKERMRGEQLHDRKQKVLLLLFTTATRLLRILHVFFSFPNYILKAGRKALIELQMSIAMLHFKFPKLFCDKKK